MPRAPRARQVDNADAIRLFAEHHIVAVRKARRNGEIIAVKHVGIHPSKMIESFLTGKPFLAAAEWITPGEFYLRQEIHRILPNLVEKTIEGGYRLKQAIWGWEIDLEILASGAKVPAGLAIIAGALALSAIDAAEGNPAAAMFDLLALGLPFGELWLLYRGVVDAGVLASGLQAAAGTALENSILPPIQPPIL